MNPVSTPPIAAPSAGPGAPPPEAPKRVAGIFAVPPVVSKGVADPGDRSQWRARRLLVEFARRIRDRFRRSHVGTQSDWEHSEFERGPAIEEGEFPHDTPDNPSRQTQALLEMEELVRAAWKICKKEQDSGVDARHTRKSLDSLFRRAMLLGAQAIEQGAKASDVLSHLGLGMGRLYATYACDEIISLKETAQDLEETFRHFRVEPASAEALVPYFLALPALHLSVRRKSATGEA